MTHQIDQLSSANAGASTSAQATLSHQAGVSTLFRT